MDVSLQDIFNFSDADLQDNRNGALSAAQHTQLKQEFWRNRILAIALLTIAWGLVACLGTLIFLGNSGLYLVIASIVVLFCPILIVIGNARRFISQGLREILVKSEIKWAEGDLLPLRQKSGVREGQFEYALMVSNTRFNIDSERYEQLSGYTSQNYKVYYLQTPKMTRIISIEPLETS